MIFETLKIRNYQILNCNIIPISVQKTRIQVSMPQSLELTFNFLFLKLSMFDKHPF